MSNYAKALARPLQAIGEMMIDKSRSLASLRMENKSRNDYVTEVDRMSEEMICEAIRKAFPDHSIYSEEAGWARRKDGPMSWIIDPLDGTTNYIHGLDQYCISLCLTENGSPLAGIVYQPATDKLYYAEKGLGAYCNNVKLRVSDTIAPERALIATGFPVVDQSYADEHLAIVKKIIAQTAGIRREGSAALDLCSVAAGRYDGFFEFNLKPWDVAAGALIALEARGFVTDLSGGQDWLNTGHIVAGNDKIVAFILKNAMQTRAEMKIAEAEEKRAARRAGRFARAVENAPDPAANPAAGEPSETQTAASATAQPDRVGAPAALQADSNPNSAPQSETESKPRADSALHPAASPVKRAKKAAKATASEDKAKDPGAHAEAPSANAEKKAPQSEAKRKGAAAANETGADFPAEGETPAEAAPRTAKARSAEGKAKTKGKDKPQAQANSEDEGSLRPKGGQTRPAAAKRAAPKKPAAKGKKARPNCE